MPEAESPAEVWIWLPALLPVSRHAFSGSWPRWKGTRKKGGRGRGRDGEEGEEEGERREEEETGKKVREGEA